MGIRAKVLKNVNIYKYRICTPSHWTSIRCWTIADIYMYIWCIYWNVNKSQYVIDGTVEQVRKVIDSNFTNKHEQSNIGCCIHIRGDRNKISCVVYNEFQQERALRCWKIRLEFLNFSTANKVQMVYKKNMFILSGLILRKSNNVFHFMKFRNFFISPFIRIHFSYPSISPSIGSFCKSNWIEFDIKLWTVSNPSCRIYTVDSFFLNVKMSMMFIFKIQLMVLGCVAQVRSLVYSFSLKTFYAT